MKLKGFFSSEVLDNVGVNGPGSAACEKCGLASGCKSPRMGYTGLGQKRILIVAESPSEAEDNSGKPFTGDTGKWFISKMKELGIDVETDCWKTNAVGCHSTKVTKAHVAHCSTRLMRTIKELKPKYIWLMGTDAIHSLFHKRESNTTAERWRGLCIPDVELNAWIMPLYHPQFIIRNEKDNHLGMTYTRDLQNVVKWSRYADSPKELSLKGAKIVKKFDDVCDLLEGVLNDVPEKFAFDYETTGLKPYRSGHKIATMSFAIDPINAYAFPYQYRQHWNNEQLTYIGDLWCDIMEHKGIKKVMHNSKFEDMWTREIMGCDINNKWWCSMNTAHILDGRTEFSGLKFQALIRWGVPDYDSSIEKYLKGTKESPYNKVMEAPLNDLLLYNAIDSLLTYNLQEIQESELKELPSQEKARQFFQNGLHTLCNLQENGIPLNPVWYKEKDVELAAKISTMKDSLQNFDEAKKFMRLKGRPINFASNTDLSMLFYDILGLAKTKETASGNGSVDAAALAAFDTPIAKEITKISKLEKIKGTYLGQFNREIEDDLKLHPFFDLHTTNTYRGSSSSPNFQNIPVRDFEAMSITRGGIIPSLGNQLVDWDYGSMEVRIIACVTLDPILISYIENPKSDMHRDQAMDWFSFTEKEWSEIDKKEAKAIRFEAKNGMVFALFYGSYYGSIAKSMFPKLKELKCGDTNLFDHLRRKGIIRSLSSAQDDFEAHTKKVEQRFWNKFKGVKAWQEKAFADYLKKGYIEQMFGFRCGGWLSKNDICNYPIQGTAFHCLVWSLNTLDERMRQEQMVSKLIGQIHDCCLGDINPEEHDHWCYLSHKIATKEIREAHKWIIVPLDIEFEESPIDASWAVKKEFFPAFLKH